MDASWSIVVDFTLLSLFLGIATYLKRRVHFLQRFIIPTSMVAGFIGLILGPEVLNIVDLDIQRLGNIVYHLMAIGFIALALKDRNREKNKEVTKTGAYIVSTYLIQGIVGLGVSLILVNTLYPDLFPPFGLLLPLGYGQGPGQAYSIGTQWEQLGFSNGGNIGLSVATLGFLWACIIGILLINFLTHKKKAYKILEPKTTEPKKIYEESEQGDIPLSGSIDRISIQLFLIGIVYLATYLTLRGLSIVLNPLGNFGQTLSQLLWGFHFIIGTIYAILLRVIFDFQKKRGKMTHNYPNNYLLQRISGGAFDFMITASISAISIYTLKEYIVPILLITSLGGLVTVLYTIFLCKKIFKKHILEYIVALYGMLTGTISTGLALLKEVDPNFETPVAENLVLGSAIGLFLGLPLMLILNIPVFAYVSNQPQMYAYTFLAFIGYLSVLYIFVLRRK
ncbi:sodium/glutamate symporter [Caldisalinibacter kiritimatiensis]|uniref:Sodium/glutamate symporter n=1 Tax=Caldisalinibacter kiritimatiensis TaxID=1304284 RepID=R1CPX2_9FIRM|nr:sodium/glutamate symporter [Caldisalinibacter kiritimatiensis]EOD00731.1 hypothetical protein L21TH_1183 [Caldisalinibacter kiritimatiensis]